MNSQSIVNELARTLVQYFTLSACTNGPCTVRTPREPMAMNFVRETRIKPSATQ